jgi:hypothetical protein
MPVTVQVNGTSLTLVHKFSNGISTATVPDVCKTPTPGGPVPMPYPNIAQSITLSDGTTTVKGDKAMAANKGSKFALSNGDQAGTLGGVKSNVFMKEATWILYSFDVKLQNKNACRLTDPMYHNAENTVNMAGVTQLSRVADLLTEQLCAEFCAVVTANFTKTGNEWVKNPGVPKTDWSNNLEAALGAQTSRWARFGAGASALTEKVVSIGFNSSFRTMGLAGEFDVIMNVNGAPYQTFDFKFPGDRWRNWQFEKYQVVTGGRPPRTIATKEDGGECDCG